MSPTEDDLSQLHRPVLLAEVLMHFSAAGLERPGALVVDGTVGLGGHAAAILEAFPDVALLGFDRDPEALRLAERRLARFTPRVTLVHGSYAEMAAVLAERKLAAPRAVLLDVGASSVQLDQAARGFSFRGGTARADMRFDPSEGVTAAEWLDRVDEAELVRVLRDYGGEPKARAVARALIRGRPFSSVEQLAYAARRSALRTKRIDPATRTFQALRMAVNDEPGHLARGLAAATQVLADGGRLAVIAFHSGEERLVKAAFREAVARGRGRVVTKKPIRSSEDEVRSNPRARPARLRVFAVGVVGGEAGGEAGGEIRGAAGHASGDEDEEQGEAR